VIGSASSIVQLRPPALEDVDALSAATDADSSPFAKEGETARARLLKRIERKPTLEDDGFLGLVIEHQGAPVGEIQARAPRYGMPPGGCEIGVSLLPEARGVGLGREAVRLLTDHLLDLGFHRVQATTSLANAAMRRVLEQLAYSFEGTLRDYAPDGEGRREDYAMYSFTARDRETAGLDAGDHEPD
jgi:RimJ/RimL family protein N-acetyltransferase